MGGYSRKDGTYVPGHMGTNPDNSFWNNYSPKGNVNPYTGGKSERGVGNHSGCRADGFASACDFDDRFESSSESTGADSRHRLPVDGQRPDPHTRVIRLVPLHTKPLACVHPATVL